MYSKSDSSVVIIGNDTKEIIQELIFNNSLYMK